MWRGGAGNEVRRPQRDPPPILPARLTPTTATHGPRVMTGRVLTLAQFVSHFQLPPMQNFLPPAGDLRPLRSFLPARRGGHQAVVAVAVAAAAAAAAGRRRWHVSPDGSAAERVGWGREWNAAAVRHAG